MPFDINGAILQEAAEGISVVTNDTTGLTFDSSGNTVRSSRPYFIAQGNTNVWTNYTSAAWNTIVIANTIVNNGSNYNTSNGRFTAPVSGCYIFWGQTYTQKYPTTTNSGYTHPLFRVNDSTTTRHASYTTQYRLRSRTYYTSSYSTDTRISQLFELVAGDYVTMSIYSSTSLRHYSTRDLFGGWFVG